MGASPGFAESCCLSTFDLIIAAFQTVFCVPQDAHRDPGYWGTSRMLLEAGLCLAHDSDLLAKSGYASGGVLTPASAMGTVLMRRLQAAGVKFQILENESGNI